MTLTTRLVPSFIGSFLDYPSKEDMCLSLYFTGCSGLCPECQNPELQIYEYGKEFSLEEIINIISTETNRLRTKKITLLGGDPLFIHNREFVKILLEKTGNIFDYCVYTGYDVDFVKLIRLTKFQFLKTGLYDHTQKQDSVKTDEYIQLASKNQKIYTKNFSLLSYEGKMYFN